MKFSLYLIVFYFFGFYYAKVTEGTVFDHFLIMLAIVFFIILLIEWVFSKRKKEEHDEKDEVLAEIMQEVQKEFEKTWHVTYKDYQIRIVNEYNGEKLFINDELIAEKKRTNWLSWLKSSQTLKGTFEDNGKQVKIVVKIGGILSLNCVVYVDNKQIFHDKIKFNLFTGETKDKDKNED